MATVKEMKTIDIDQSFYDLRWSGTGAITARERNRVATTLAMVPDECKSVLDVGAGDGVISNELIARGKELVAVDISEVALSRVQGKTLLRSADDLKGVEDRSFDLVVCTEMLEHLDDNTFHGALKEFNRTARRAIMITVPNRENMKENLGRCGHCGELYHIWGHRRRFAPPQLRSLFPSFESTAIVSFGDNLRRYNPLLLWMRTQVAGSWAHDELSPCPNCHSHKPAVPRRPRLAALTDLVNSNIPHLPYKPWLLALYRRK